MKNTIKNSLVRHIFQTTFFFYSKDKKKKYKINKCQTGLEQEQHEGEVQLDPIYFHCFKTKQQQNLKERHISKYPHLCS